MNILLTGGSRGLGLEIVRQQVAIGNTVFAVSRTISSELRQLIDAHADKVQYVECDLSDTAAVEQIFSDQIPNSIKIDGFVNNAAMAYDDLVTNLNVDRLEAMFRTNVFSAMNLTKHTIRRMLLHKVSGSIVHISSISVHTGYKGLAMYAATKGAIEAFSRNTAREWGSMGIRSNCVVAGFMETDMSASLSPEQREKIYRRNALGQATEVASVAATVGHLLLSASRSTTGQNLFVDSGTI